MCVLAKDMHNLASAFWRAMGRVRLGGRMTSNASAQSQSRREPRSKARAAMKTSQCERNDSAIPLPMV